MHEQARCSGGRRGDRRCSPPARGRWPGAPIAATNKLSHRLSTSHLLTFSTSSLVPLQRFNGSRLQRAAKLQCVDASPFPISHSVVA